MRRLFFYTFLLFTFACPLILSSCYQFFESKVNMTTDNTSTLDDLISDTAAITQLDSPAQIFVSDGLYAGTITITWSSVTDADSYRLERAVVTSKSSDGSFAVPDEGAFDVIAGTSSTSYISGTSYTDTILSSPSSNDSEYSYGYFYRVCAENTLKKYDSSTYTVSTVGSLFAPPMNTKASLGDSSSNIKITWTKSANAKSYKIYRSPNSDASSSSLIGSVTSNQNWFNNTIDDENQGSEFYYTVYAVNSSGNESASSSIALGYSLVSGAPAQASGVTIVDKAGRGDTTSSTGISVSWNSVTADGTVYYAIYRTSSTDSSYTLLKEDETSTSYTDKKSLKPNVFYYYQVQAWILDSDGSTKLKGKFSASSSSDSSPAEGYIISPPQTLVVSKYSDDTANCRLYFPAAIGSEDCISNSSYTTNTAKDFNTYSYNIYSCETQSGTYSLLTTADSSATSSDGYYTVKASTASFYKISTVNGTVESAFSDAAAPAPYAVTSASATQHAKFDGGTYSDGTAYTFSANSSGVYPVKITWSEPTGGADGGYYVYRSTKSSSGFRKITDDAVSDTYYIDENDTAKTGTYYYYKVLSLNSLGDGTNYSDVVTGYGALTADQYMREYNKTVKASQKKLTLMHKSGNTAKLGEETISGDLSGTLYYHAYVSGVSGRVIMKYTNYADYYISSDSSLGYYFYINGNTNTSASMDQSGTMDGTVTCTGMYPGTVGYDNIKIIGGGANGGTYAITRQGFDEEDVSYTVGNE